MISGIVYTLVGIKNKWLHISISAAYLSSLAVTVLIVYVMNPPISNGVQGAYVVAAVLTGIVLGGASLIFTEMTEGLGSLFGGFCLSMWLLCLRPGGLLTATSSKAILIAVFTVAVFSTSFSHYTRPYGLIVSISFGGATALVMGIDCFSKAGLKEFWVYLWNLNDNLFPLGVTTYPLTRGIKVEISAIIIIFLAGIVSQMKLWKIIKERREQRASERTEDERTMEQEEENVGRRIEHANAQERDQWEAVYGDKDPAKSSGPSNRDSGVGDMDSQKKGPTSTVTSVRRSGEDDIELAHMPSSPTLTTGAGLVMANQGKDRSPVTVRVARDTEPTIGLDESENRTEQNPKIPSRLSQRQEEGGKISIVGTDGEASLEKPQPQRNSKRVSSSPEVVPLPFKAPLGRDDDNRSSIATFADEEQADHRRGSRHLAAGLDIVKRLSQRSNRSSQRVSMGEGRSTEDLVLSRGDIEDDRASSIVATLDDLSDDEDMRSVRSSIVAAPDTTVSARIPDITTTAPESRSTPRSTIIAGKMESSTNQVPADTVGSTTLDPEPSKEDKTEEVTSASDKVVAQRSLTSSTDPKDEVEATAQENTSLENGEGGKAEPSIVPTVEPKPTIITKDRLPSQISKVVMTYRTNEWAKHLSQADTPEVEDLKLAECPPDVQHATAEKAAPVNVEDLQQTALVPASASSQRTVSQISNYGVTLPTKSTSSELITPSASSRPESVNGQDASLTRSSSQQSQTRGMGFRASSSPNIPKAIVESPIEEHFPSTPPFSQASKFVTSNVPYGTPTTLMERRDSMLRNKPTHYQTQASLPPTPEMQFTSQYNSPNSSKGRSDAGSIYNYSNISIPEMEDENMSLAARRNLIRQSSLHNTSPLIQPLQQTPVIFDAHLPQRQSSVPSATARDQQLASWRANVQNDLRSSVIPKKTIERQRSALRQERQAEEQRRMLEERMRLTRDVAFDEMMRRGDFQDAHREALRKMQASANKHA